MLIRCRFIAHFSWVKPLKIFTLHEHKSNSDWLIKIETNMHYFIQLSLSLTTVLYLVNLMDKEIERCARGKSKRDEKENNWCHVCHPT